MKYGKNNISAGLLFMAGFMTLGFVMIYLRDFAPGKEQWITDYAVGTHFESRLAHVHGNLFAFLNIVIGYLWLRFPFRHVTSRWVSRRALAGMLMPVGILAEVVLGAPPVCSSSSGQRPWWPQSRGLALPRHGSTWLPARSHRSNTKAPVRDVCG